MSELLLHEGFSKSPSSYPQMESIVRARTLTLLSRLDKGRKRSVLQFLYESGLIDKDKCTISSIVGADLSEADLSGAYLSGANLSGADLSRAALSRADLSEADLSEADLSEVDLSEANLSGAIVTNEQLKLASSLKGATMPDGSTHP